eukprot:1206915-Rhodomonas_salina.1
MTKSNTKATIPVGSVPQRKVLAFDFGVCTRSCTQFPFTAQQGIGIVLSISGNFLISGVYCVPTYAYRYPLASTITPVHQPADTQYHIKLRTGTPVSPCAYH